MSLTTPGESRTTSTSRPLPTIPGIYFRKRQLYRPVNPIPSASRRWLTFVIPATREMYPHQWTRAGKTRGKFTNYKVIALGLYRLRGR